MTMNFEKGVALYKEGDFETALGAASHVGRGLLAKDSVPFPSFPPSLPVCLSLRLSHSLAHSLNRSLTHTQRLSGLKKL
jgi:hypothetical protein